MKAKRLLCFALCLAMLVAMFAGRNVTESGDEVEETTASKKPVVTKPVTTPPETEAVTEEGTGGEDATGGEDVTGGGENNTKTHQRSKRPKKQLRTKSRKIYNINILIYNLDKKNHDIIQTEVKI